MTEQFAALAGTYHNLRPVVGRKVFQVHVELPIEHMSAFVRAFGEPNPDTWIALARMEVVPDNHNRHNATTEAPPDPVIESTSSPGRAKRFFDELPRSQQAALACRRMAFRRFLFEKHNSIICGYHEPEAATIILGTTDDDELAVNMSDGIIKFLVGIQSKTELDGTDPRLHEKWDRLYQSFTDWLHVEPVS